MSEPTYYARKLAETLRNKGIDTELEYDDGHKSVDIFIPEVNLEIEVDGSQHYTDSMQAFTDLMRTKYSMLKGKETIRIPNTLIYNYLPQIADLIEEIVKDRINRNITRKVTIFTKEKTLEQTLPKKIIEEYKVKFNLAKAKKFFERKDREKKKKIKHIVIISVVIAIILFIVLMGSHNNPEISDNNIQEQMLTIISPAVAPFTVAGSNTEVIIKNNQQKAISVNVTYNIYSRWFGIDEIATQIFNVSANSEKAFQVYYNNGCATAPCGVRIISSTEIG